MILRYIILKTDFFVGSLLRQFFRYINCLYFPVILLHIDSVSSSVYVSQVSFIMSRFVYIVCINQLFLLRQGFALTNFCILSSIDIMSNMFLLSVADAETRKCHHTLWH